MDISRFGRDYITVGNYISCVFPFLGVRFISVNDGFDSIRPAEIDSLDTSFKTLLYDLYSRDLSRKVRSAKRFRAQRGDFLSPFAPYGYIKDPDNKNHLAVDPEAAQIVRRIFSLAAEGRSAEQIALLLNREAVPTPTLHKRAAGCSRTRWPSIREDNFWNKSSIAMILMDERYTGKSIYGKHTRASAGSPHIVSVSREDWVTVENTHDGIVTQEEFDRVNARACAEQGERKLRDWPLRGKIRCGVCGYAMERRMGGRAFYVCRTPRVTDAYACSGRVREDEILKAVSDELRVQAAMAVEMNRVWEEQRREQKKDISIVRKKLAGLREVHQRLSRQINGLYESFALGETSKPEYLAAKAAAVKQRDDAAGQIRELEAVLDNMGTNGSLQNGFVSAFGKYFEVGEITSEITADVLKEVRVFSDNRIEIVWNYRDELEKLMLDLQGDHQDGT